MASLASTMIQPDTLDKIQDAVNGMSERPGVVAAGLGAVIAGSMLAYSYQSRLDFPGPGYGVAALRKMALAGEQGKTIEWMDEMESKYGKIFAIQGPLTRLLFIFDDELIREVYALNTEVVAARNIIGAFKKTLGPILFSGNGPEWKHARNLVSKVIASRHMRYSFDVAKAKILEMFKSWDAMGDSVVVDVGHELRAVSQNMSYVQMIGDDAHETKEESDRNVKAYDLVDEVLFARFTLPEALMNWIVPQPKLVDETVQKLRNKIRESVVQKLKAPASENETRGHDLIDAMIEGDIPDARAVESTIVAGFFGNRTIPGDIAASTLYLLWQHPHCIERAREEIRTRLGYDRDVIKSHADMEKLPYIDGIVKEGFRYYPSVMVTGRELAVDYKIGDKVIPKGTNVLLNQRKLLLNDKYFEEAGKFKPERWLNASEWLQPRSFVPFGAGPRQCPGRRMGQNNNRIIIAMIIQNYDWEVLPHKDPMPMISGFSSRIGRVNLKFTRRKFD